MVFVVCSNKITDLRSTKKLKKNYQERNIHNSLRFFLIFSQLLGILPQANISESYKKIHFKWKSWRVLYTSILIVLTSTVVIFCFLAWFYVGFHFADFETQVFYSGSAITLVLYLQLATSWSKLMTSWCRMDKIMNCNYGYPKNLDIRLKICFVAFLLLALTDYSLNVTSRYVRLKNLYQDRYNFGIYYEALFPQLFLFVPLNILGAIYCSMMTVHASITWAFNDLFIILMSIGLALRFKQITDKLEKNYTKEQPGQFWIEIREDYDRLTILCKELDDSISCIVLLSYFINIFFLLAQLYNSLQSVQGVLGQIYFIFSFIYLIVKLVSVSLYAAWINDESSEPAAILNSVSSSSYNIEIKRLLLQIDCDNVALTGSRMFRVTRGIILSIAGAVVTYELVLIQFNMATSVKH